MNLPTSPIERALRNRRIINWLSRTPTDDVDAFLPGTETTRKMLLFNYSEHLGCDLIEVACPEVWHDSDFLDYLDRAYYSAIRLGNANHC